MNIAPKSRSKNIVVQGMNNEVLIYDLDANRAVCLNQTAAIIWKMCDGSRAISSIAEDAGRHLGETVTDELVWLAIDQLNAENLLLNGDIIGTRFDGLSRREIIAKVGLASMVALPIVSSIVAPDAIAAQSATCSMPIGQCTPPDTVNVCPPECTGSTINATFYVLDATCTAVAGMNSFVCMGSPLVFNEFYTIQSIT